jgi:hypothetical protein
VQWSSRQFPGQDHVKVTSLTAEAAATHGKGRLRGLMEPAKAGFAY